MSSTLIKVYQSFTDDEITKAISTADTLVPDDVPCMYFDSIDQADKVIKDCCVQLAQVPDRGPEHQIILATRRRAQAFRKYYSQDIKHMMLPKKVAKSFVEVTECAINYRHTKSQKSLFKKRFEEHYAKVIAILHYYKTHWCFPINPKFEVVKNERPPYTLPHNERVTATPLLEAKVVAVRSCDEADCGAFIELEEFQRRVRSRTEMGQGKPSFSDTEEED